MKRLAAISLLLAICGTSEVFAGPTAVNGPTTFASDDDFLDYVEHQTFNYFWVEANPNNGLVELRSDQPTTCSISAVGFGLSAIHTGISRGWVTRDQGRARVLAALQTLYNAPQGSNSSGFAGYHGWFYHHLDINTGLRKDTSELSSSDTALLMSGVLDAGQFFNDPTNADEATIRLLSANLFNRVDFRFLLNSNDNTVYLHWTPETGYSSGGYKGYNEVAELYLYGLGTTNNPLPPASWNAWVSGFNWTTYYGQSYAYISRLFCYQYSQCFIDFRGIADAYMRGKGSDYFENSRRASLAQQAYAIADPTGYSDYGSNEWGFTSCSGPAGYGTYGAPGGLDDGTIAPTAATSSMPFAPEICLPTVKHLYFGYTNQLWTTEGFRDSVNVASNWFCPNTLAIDEGPIVLMIENYRTGALWSRMLASPVVQRGLQQAGFTAPPPDTVNATLVSSNQAYVSWSGISTYQTGFQVQTSVDGINYTAAATVGSNTYSAAISVAPDTVCYIRVVTTSGAGLSSARQTVIIPGAAPTDVVLYEPFDYGVGLALDGQGAWYLSGTASLGKVQAGSLSVPGLMGAVGSCYTWPAGNDSVRLPVETRTNEAVYFSFALRVDQIGSFTGHDTFTGLALDAATTYYPKLDVVCVSSNAYQVGIYKGSGTTFGAVATNTFTTNDIVFLVTRYSFNTNSTTDDTCDLWINPDPSTFGTDTPPPPTIASIGSGAADAAGIDRFTWRGSTSGAQKKTADELRVGHTWSEVTPLPQIVLSIATSGTTAILSWPTNGASGFILESNSTLNDPQGWGPVSGVSVQGASNTASADDSSGQRFFRLRR
jgi:hypothetical protein